MSDDDSKRLREANELLDQAHEIALRGVEISNQLDRDGYSRLAQVPILGGALVIAFLSLPPDQRERHAQAHFETIMELLKGTKRGFDA